MRQDRSALRLPQADNGARFSIAPDLDFPFNSGGFRTSTAGKKASKSTCKMTRIATLYYYHYLGVIAFAMRQWLKVKEWGEVRYR